MEKNYQKLSCPEASARLNLHECCRELPALPSVSRLLRAARARNIHEKK